MISRISFSKDLWCHEKNKVLFNPVQTVHFFWIITRDQCASESIQRCHTDISFRLIWDLCEKCTLYLIFVKIYCNNDLLCAV